MEAIPDFKRESTQSRKHKPEEVRSSFGNAEQRGSKVSGKKSQSKKVEFTPDNGSEGLEPPAHNYSFKDESFRNPVEEVRHP